MYIVEEYAFGKALNEQIKPLDNVKLYPSILWTEQYKNDYVWFVYKRPINKYLAFIFSHRQN